MTLRHQPAAPASAAPSRRAVLLSAGLIVFTGLAAYFNSFAGAFVFVDVPSILENPTIQHLRLIGETWWPPPGGLTVSGRPLVNFSLALNHAFGGNAPWSYHALNLAIHLLAGLTLFGLLHRTLQRPRLAARFGADASALALAVALLWTVHPLQTESVSYTVQRAESLAGLFYLLTVYLFARSTESSSPSWWLTAATAACLLGMATKETMATAPLVVLLYDRTFLSGSFREAWQRRGPWYLGLASTWLLLGWLVLSNGSRGGSAGFGAPAAWWSYALSQFPAILHYLRLALWPQVLIFDYGSALVTSPLKISSGIIGIGLLLAATGYALRRRPALGFAGAWFFVILAPSSSIVPVATQIMAEHRMYLPLAAVIALAVLGLYHGLGRFGLLLCLPLAGVLLGLTLQRNRDYRSGLSLWSQTVRACPENPRAHLNFGHALAASGQWPGAVVEYEQALRLQPDYAEAHYNWANALVELNRPEEAGAHYGAALQLRPGMVEAHYNWANALSHSGQLRTAAAHYEAALRLRPDHAKAHYNLGNTLVDLGRLPEAISHYSAALRLAPDYADAHLNLGNALMQSDRAMDAIVHYQAAMALDPTSADTHNSLGTAFLLTGHRPEAIAEFEQALRQKPGFAEAAKNLALARQARR